MTYTTYAGLAAVEVEGVDYTRTSIRPAGAAWAAIAIHGGGIEPGTGELARAVAGSRMSYYEFAGIKPSGNSGLHITSALFDEPQCVALVGASRRVLSIHGFVGTVGVAETLIGGLDLVLRDKVQTALTAAGFTVTVANSELTGTDPTNICNRALYKAGVQLELSDALRASFFPGGDVSRAMRDSGQRTAAFTAYTNAVASVMTLALVYDPVLSRVRITGVAPGVQDTFTRTVVDDWGTANSGQDYSTSGGAATDYQVAAGVGTHKLGVVNSSRWTILNTAVADADVTVSVSTGVLAAGGSHFLHLAARFADTNNAYLARLEYTTTQTVLLTLRKRVSGVETLLVSFTTALTHAANTKFRVRLQVIGSTLKAKAWLASTVEPAAWQLTTTDTALTAAGAIGLRSLLSTSNTNPLPVTSSWDDLATTGLLTLERSVDGVRWTTVRGGADGAGTAGTALAADDYEFSADRASVYRARVADPVTGVTLWIEQDLIVATLDRVWLKSVVRPFLNQAISLGGRDFTASRPARGSVHDVVGRSLPVAVTDVRGSRRYTLTLRTSSAAAGQNLDYILASGDVLYLHAPAGKVVPADGVYVRVEGTEEHRLGLVDELRHWTVPVVEVAAPGPDVIGRAGTCQTVLNAYATCADVLAAFATCADLLTRIAPPSEVIVS